MIKFNEIGFFEISNTAYNCSFWMSLFINKLHILSVGLVISSLLVCVQCKKTLTSCLTISYTFLSFILINELIN